MTTNIALLRDPAWSDEAPIPKPTDIGSRTGAYPRMLKLGEKISQRLDDYLYDEITSIRIQKQPLIDDWNKWQGQYWATPKQKVKNFPFARAANIVVPLTAIAVEAVHARLMNTIFSVQPFWSVRPRTQVWQEASKPVEKFLQAEAENEDALDVFPFCQETMLELCKLGTGIGKSGYERITKKAGRSFEEGPDEEVFVTVKDSATLDYVPVANFLMRTNEPDPQEASVVGEEHEFTWAQLKRMSADGRIRPDKLDEIKVHWVNSREGDAGDGGRYQRELDKQAHTEPHWYSVFKVQELWLGFDVDNDGWDEEIVVDYHHESRTILSVRYNWYDDLHRPYRVVQYIKVEGRWVGIGIGKQNEQFQDEITTIHRQRLDNGTLANMRMMGIKKTSGYGPDEPIFPGKLWFLDEPDDIKPIQLSELYPSGFGNEEVTRRYSEMRTGVNEVLVGLPQEGTPGTATDTLARIEEGSKRFALVLKNVRRWLSLLGMDVLSNYQQFGAGQRHFMVLDQEGQWVEEVLNLPSGDVRNGAAVELTASDSIINRQVEQQQWTTLATVMGQYYDRAANVGITLLQLGGNPELVAWLLRNALIASDEVTRRLLETFDVVNTDKMLLTSQKELPGGGSPSDVGAVPGSAGGIPPLTFPAGVGGLAGGGQAGNAGSGQANPGLAQ